MEFIITKLVQLGMVIWAMSIFGIVQGLLFVVLLYWTMDILDKLFRLLDYHVDKMEKERKQNEKTT